MAYSTDFVTGTHQSIAEAIGSKLNSLSITTLHAISIVKIGSDFLLAVIVYE